MKLCWRSSSVVMVDSRRRLKAMRNASWKLGGRSKFWHSEKAKARGSHASSGTGVKAGTCQFASFCGLRQLALESESCGPLGRGQLSVFFRQLYM